MPESAEPPDRPEFPAVDGHQGFRGLTSETVLFAKGELILAELVSPAIRSSKYYDRITSFFDLNSFLAVALGIEALWRRGGRMRLVIGLHSVPSDLVAAKLDRDRWPEQVLEELRRRLLEQVSTLRDEISTDRLRALAWMLRGGLLNVKVAFPALPDGRPSSHGIFHPKTYLFTSAEGDRLAATGSANETVPALGSNVETLDVFRSWEPGEARRVNRHFEIFEALWDGGVPGTRVVELDRGVADDLLRRLGVDPTVVGPSSVVAGSLALRVLARARESPAFALVSSGQAGLYPHQELAFLEALGRWPVRVLLADEVGLGKTLEAGSVLSYLRRFGQVRRILILAPRSLMHQWQEELWLRFGIRAWRYESEVHTFVDPEDNSMAIPIDRSPVGDVAPDVAIVSAQLVRGRGPEGGYFRSGERRPDVLIVDEAHHARIRPQGEGSSSYQTRLWEVLDRVAPDIPHLILLTATPMQLDWTEFHATLRLLGLPSSWQSRDSYEDSLRVLSRGEKRPSLDDAQAAVNAMRSSAVEYAIPEAVLRSGVGSDGMNLVSVRQPATADELILARAQWARLFPLFVRLHPAHLLTVRRTRSALIKMGYTFPERHLLAPALTVSQQVRDFYRAVVGYLHTTYGAVEATVFPDSPGGRGFAKSTYYQRMASSLTAAESSLRRRADWLGIIERTCDSGAIPSGVSPPGAEDDDEEPEDILGVLARMRPADRELPKALAGAERADIKTLLTMLGRLPRGLIGDDPKLEKLCELIRGRLAGERILVFSRYTDTVTACVAAVREAWRTTGVPPFAVYTGQERWADLGRGPQPASKETIRQMLRAGSIDIVFCSDAAAEGLNLQAARTVINVDVPWNPSKLEQRIGRVDRLGQTSAEVNVHNLWYPDSVEAIMYGRLAQRHDLYQLAVGEAQEIFAAAIRDEVGRLLFGETSGLSRADPLDSLQAVREDLQIQAHERVWASYGEMSTVSEKFRRSLGEIVRRLVSGDRRVIPGSGPDDFSVTSVSSGPAHVDVRAGSDDCLTLEHPILKALLTDLPASGEATGDRGELLTLSCDSLPILFAIRSSTGIRVVPPSRFPEMLGAVALNEPFLLDGCPSLSADSTGAPDVASVAAVVTSVAGWLPDHRALTARGLSGGCTVPLAPRSDDSRWTLDPMGHLSIMRDALAKT